MAMLLTEGSTVLKQMQRWNNSLASETRLQVQSIGFYRRPERRK